MEKINQAIDEINKVVKGKTEVVRFVLMAIASGGHILMEDIPGVGKTTLALTVSKVFGLKCRRMQFTPDVLPSDVVGFNMFNKAENRFEYVNGAVFCNLFLADEINRTSPKTQSALLEVMEEGSVTVDGVTRVVPEPFVTIATQNPFGSAGTQRLPQSQLERFMIRISMGYPDEQSEINILKNKADYGIERVKSIISADELREIKNMTQQCFVKDNIYAYIVDVVNKTRNSKYFAVGISPRGSIAILKMARANAVFDGRDYVVQEDVADVLEATAAHRVELSAVARAEGRTAESLLQDILKETKLRNK
jgi:MoxR-like ATPase